MGDTWDIHGKYMGNTMHLLYTYSVLIMNLLCTYYYYLIIPTIYLTCTFNELTMYLLCIYYVPTWDMYLLCIT